MIIHSTLYEDLRKIKNMKLVWAVIPLILVGVIGVQESYSEKVIGIRGMIFENGTTILDPWYRIESKIDIPLDNPGNVRIQYYDINDKKIAETGFNYEPTCLVNGEIHCFDFMGFLLRIPDIGDFKKIVFLRDSQFLSEKIVSSNPPIVKILYPNGGEVFRNNESITMKWESSDLDGDDLTFMIQISDDDGNTWNIRSFDIPTNEFEFRFYHLESDSVLIRVIASDGINTSSDISDEPFTVTDLLSPLKQVKDGIMPTHVICKSGVTLIFKSSDNSPACVKPQTAEKLIERGWTKSP
jgi:hypothetical protein